MLIFRILAGVWLLLHGAPAAVAESHEPHGAPTASAAPGPGPGPGSGQGQGQGPAPGAGAGVSAGAPGAATAPAAPLPPSIEAGGSALAVAPLRVTTDTPEYCNTLAERVARAEKARPGAALQAEELAEEGHSMCAEGLIRGGLVRLRRALLLLRGGE